MAASPTSALASVAIFPDGFHLSYVASTGEVNSVTVSYAAHAFTIVDTTAVIAAGLGCASVDEHHVTCAGAAATPESLFSFVIDAGDLDDSVSVAGSPISNSVNQVSGGDGDDTLNGGPGAEILNGGTGADSLNGGTGADSLNGGDGSDALNAGGGDDSMQGGLNADAMVGGEGRDMVTYSAANSSLGVTVTIDGTANDGNVEDGPPGARDNVATDVEFLQGSGGDDTLTGGAGDDALDGYAGDDTVNGGDGDDVLTDGGGGDDTLNGGAGGDSLQGGGGADGLNGGSGIDTVDYYDHDFMTPSVTVDLDGVADDGFVGENDNAGSDVENIIGSPLGDILTGSGGDNVIRGEGGNDTLNGLGGADILLGGLAFGTIISGGADDALNGGEGSDLLDGGVGADGLNGGPGFDLADYSERSNTVTVDLDGAAGDDGEASEGDTVGADIEAVAGGAGDDVLTGNANENLLFGGEGDDLLDGGAGADNLFGGPGVDDAVDYSSRSAPVSVVLDGSPTSGESGEGDTVEVDVEDAIGGSGPDIFVGGVQDNFFDGGPGADSFTGGDGIDAVDYSGRLAAVSVTFDGSANDGAAGEGDNAGAGMEAVFGGSGDDHLTGDASANFFSGGDGADVIDGAAGDDLLLGGFGNDTLTGGGGIDLFSGDADNDSIQSRDGNAEPIACGGGSDVVVGDLGDEDVAGDCELLHRGPPLVTTGVAGAVTRTNATLVGTVNPAGQGTTVHFEFGTTAAYGTNGNNLSLNASRNLFGITATVSGLAPGTTYHYRLVASNPDGTTFGTDVTFRTQAPVLVPTPPNCVVPNVIGQSLAKARTRLQKAHCRVGKITRVRSTKRKKNHVLAEKPKPRTRLKNGAKVNLTVGRGGKK